MYTVLLKSQYYNNPARTRFGPHWFLIMEHTMVQKSYLTFPADSWAAGNSSLCRIYIVDRVMRWKL